MPPRSSKHRGSSSFAPLVDDPPLCAPSYTPSSSRCWGNGSMVKGVLRSIFCMCKTMVREVNENRRDIIEMKSEMGLPCDPHHELPEFDDPYAEWDAKDAQAAREEEEPTPAPPTRPSRTAPR
ncbi:actin-like protein ARP8 [Panicum miliaceum]|uniref:Actin-like protein ARP8 n=1 Tax=Panicum miliaceum TaxID=4540 RepID=A0A3L6QT07_PANMI|nr:actin-like protein ARP8 [Panicum miliaceum]